MKHKFMGGLKVFVQVQSTSKEIVEAMTPNFFLVVGLRKEKELLLIHNFVSEIFIGQKRKIPLETNGT